MKRACLFFLLIATARPGLSQSFQNFNFESARIISATDSLYYPYGIETTNALPGWSVYYGNNQQTQITYNDPSLGSTWATLWATNGQNIDGNYSVLLQGAAFGSSISQNGLVPLSMQSLTFRAQAGLGALDLSIGGIDIPFFALSTGPNYTLYGADISAFAGQTELLTFTALPGANSQLNNWNIDDIQFSSAAVPEPGTITLGCIGGMLLGIRVWRKSLRKWNDC